MITIKERIEAGTVLTRAYDDYAQNLNNYAFYKLNNSALGEDLVQEAFMKTWKYLVKHGKIDSMKAFLYHVLKGLITDEYRKHKPVSLEALIENGFEPSGGDYARIEDVSDGKAAIHLIAKLPEPYQKIMHMRYVRNLSIAEVASFTCQSKNNVAVQTHRGIRKLVQLYNRNTVATPVTSFQ